MLKLTLLLSVAALAAPDSVRPLLVGETIPSAEITTLDGKKTDMAEELKGSHTILVFYRGGWCPYCNRQLAALGGLKGRLKKLGWEMAAISPDRPELLLETKGKHSIDYALYSDSPCNAARAMGLAFTVEENKYRKMKNYGVDLALASGLTHRQLPIPAVYLVSPNGEVLFQYANPNYKIRLNPKVLLSAAQAYGP
ncbi:MAG: antioxidant AhpC [Elusimicrobia bacterium]|nr:MAG: antioxidant AhpC [Elusimicrobiota bacterium]